MDISAGLVIQIDSLLESLKDFSPALRIGDVYGPTDSFTIELKLGNYFLLADFGAGKWKIGFFDKQDEEGITPLAILQTKYKDTQEFAEFLKRFMNGLE